MRNSDADGNKAAGLISPFFLSFLLHFAFGFHGNPHLWVISPHGATGRFFNLHNAVIYGADTKLATASQKG